jgi:two-component system, OmpR family, sensor histidine kinase SenX3
MTQIVSSLGPPRSVARLCLLASVGVALLVGAQAVLVLLSHQRLTRQVLEDHAATALWYLELNLAADLETSVDCAFHDVLHTTSIDGQSRTLRTGSPHPVVPAAARLLTGWFADGACQDQALPRPTLAYRFGPGIELDIVGAAPAEAEVAELRRWLEAAVRQTPPLRRTDGVVAGVLGSRTVVAFYSRQQVPGGEALYAIPLDTAAVSMVLRRATRDDRLLPPTILPEAAASGVMRFSMGPAGRPVSATAASGAAVVSATRVAEPRLGGLVLAAEVTPAGAVVLARPSMSPARMVALASLLLLSLALSVLAYTQLRREEELIGLREDFVARASHELRTPLALQRILLDTVRLGRAPTPERMAWAMENLDREARRLEHLIGNLLNFAGGQRGGLELTCRPTDLIAAVERTVEALRPLAEQRDVVIRATTSSPCELLLDESLFQQALGNVIENAIRYGPRGQTISVRVTEENGNAVVQVEDEGGGIPASERSSVLEPFCRGSAARASDVGGSGIGLAVVRHVMEQHGGDVRLDDAASGGLRVRLSFPAAAVTESVDQPGLHAGAPHGHTLAKSGRGA